MKMTGSAQEEQKDAPAECSHRAIGTRFGENFPDVAQHTMRWQTHALSADFPAGACQRLSSLVRQGCELATNQTSEAKQNRTSRLKLQDSFMYLILYCIPTAVLKWEVLLLNTVTYLETYYLVASLGPAYTRTQAVPRVDKPDTIQHVCARSHKRIRSPLFIGTPA